MRMTVATALLLATLGPDDPPVARPVDLAVLVSATDYGLGAVVVNPPGILCELDQHGRPASCPLRGHAPGTVFRLRAVPREHTVFGWTGACSGSQPCRVKMSASHEAHATFARAPR